MSPSTSHGVDDLDVTYRNAAMRDDVQTILINRITWSAVAAGIVLSLVVQALLNLLGAGVGLGTISASGGDNPSAQTFSVAAGVWWALSGIIAAFIGGYAAGRLSGRPDQSMAAWHGLTTWAATTLIVIYLVSSAAGAFLGGAMNAVTSMVGGLGSVASTTAQTAAPIISSSNPFGEIEQQIKSTSGGTDPTALRDAAVASVRTLVTGDQNQAEQARQRAAEALARAQNISAEEARNQVGKYEQQYRAAVDQAKEKATAAADATAKVASRGALSALLALVLGAIAGWFGGRAGTVDPASTLHRVPR